MTASGKAHRLDKPLAITMGDPAGIGAEIIIKATREGWLHDCFVIGDRDYLEKAALNCGIKQKLKLIDKPQMSGHDRLAVMPPGPLYGQPLLSCKPLAYGKVSARAGTLAYACVERATALALNKSIAGIVTAPINKEAWTAAGIKFPGHTEMLDSLSHPEPTGKPGKNRNQVAMVLANEELKVILASVHIALKDVSNKLSIESQLSSCFLAHEACRAFGMEKPRIAVAALNPHAGEGGLFGTEEIDVIKPAIKQARLEGLNVSGPYAGDTVFARARRGEFDIVIAQYHDQGLIPVKYMGLEGGVNISIGLPFIRTSPDHGTAFDIAGKNQAKPDSLIRAIDYARRLYFRKKNSQDEK